MTLPELLDCELAVDHEADPTELHWRQIHPQFVHAGTPSSQVFTPTAKDEGCLSMDRSTVCSAEESYDAYVAQGLASSGVLAVTSMEVAGATLRVVDDSACDGKMPGHVYADFRALGTSARKRAAQLLLAAALKRGITYEP